MNKQSTNTSPQKDSWDTYWQGTGDVGAFSSGGASHPAIRAFWEEFFNNVKENYTNPEIIDIASGNGAVLERIIEAYAGQPINLTSLDLSAAAIENINQRFPAVDGLVADAAEIPRESGSFDIVTSQFGVEYAGTDAIREAARLVADNGKLVLLLHNASGSIHQECRQSLEAIKRLQASHFIPAAIEMFDAGFKAVRGADRAAYDEAGKKLAPAIKELEAIMTQYGQHVAGDTIAKLYNDVGQIHQRIQHYEPDDILNWLKRMDGELNAYAGRMSSMSEAAIDNIGFDSIQAGLRAQGLVIERAEALHISDHDLPMAWVVIAKK